MDFELDEQQRDLRDLATEILRDRASADILRERDLSGEQWLDESTWKLWGTSGLLGVALPESVGGAGGRFTDLGVLVETVARLAAPLPVLETLVLGALPIARFGTEEQQQRLLPAVAAGDSFLTAALHEPGTPDPRSVTATTAEGAPDGSWVLNGVKTLVPVADRVERIVVPAGSAAGPGVFLVDPRAAGVRLTLQVNLVRKPHFLLEMDGVVVATTDVLAQPSDGAPVLDALLDYATIGVCLSQLGATDALLELASSYVREREQFGRPIGSFQAVGHALADSFIDVTAIRLTAWHAAWLLEQTDPAWREVAIAKWWAADAGVRALNATLHVHGGIGVDLDYPAHRFYLQGRWNASLLGGASYQLDTLGERLFA